jgi:hypothetical protein
VVVEEAQFFDDLKPFVERAVDADGKHAVVVGLDGTAERRPFGQILDLVPLADRITKLTAFCTMCADGTPAIFTYAKRSDAIAAAADGVVVDVRDGMPDVSIRVGGREAVQGREAGNRVALFHGDGWLTQYSHLKQGSVAVRKGDRVQAGQRLGEIGLSGSTEFPHLEFLATYQDRVIDPFVGLGDFPTCRSPRRNCHAT